MPWLFATTDPIVDGGEVAAGFENLVDGLLRALPRLGIAVVALAIAWGAKVVLVKVLEPRLAAYRTPSFGKVFSRIIGWTAFGVIAVLGLTVLFPSIQPVDLLAGLGIFSIAIGFAFQDILSNLLAGLLLLIRQPFTGGDQIQVGDHVGTVQEINVRETVLKRFDGQEVIIPNADVYQSAIRVQTAYELARIDLPVGFGYDDDVDTALEVALEAARGVDGVLDDPAPQAYLTGFGGSSMDFDLRVWAAPSQAERRRIQHELVRAIKYAYDEHGIDIPFPIRTLDIAASTREALVDVTD